MTGTLVNKVLANRHLSAGSVIEAAVFIEANVLGYITCPSAVWLSHTQIYLRVMQRTTVLAAQ